MTSMAAEGMGIDDGGIAIADDAEALAAAVVRLHEDSGEWLRQSEAGLRWVDENTSVRIVRERLQGLLEDISAPIPANAQPSPGQGQLATVELGR